MSTSVMSVHHYHVAARYHTKAVEGIMDADWSRSHNYIALALKRLNQGLLQLDENNIPLRTRFQRLLEEWELELELILDKLEDGLFNVANPKPLSSGREFEVWEYCRKQLKICGDLPLDSSNRDTMCILTSEFALYEMGFQSSNPIQHGNAVAKTVDTQASSSADIVNKEFQPLTSERLSESTNERSPTDTDISKNEKQMQQCINDFKLLAMKGMPPTTINDIIGYNDVKELINQLFVLPKQYPQHFQRNELQHILLFGEPGCGKTAFAAAIAHEFGNCQFVLVTPSDINGKYIGESEKRLKALFEFADSVGRIVIFFDEIDGLLPSRSAPGNSGSRTLVTQFLVLTQGAFSEPKNILMVAATNLPMNVDEGVHRRFKKHIYVGMPDAFKEEQLFIHYYGKKDYDKLPERCPSDFFETQLKGFTCSDVKEFALNLKEVPFLKAMECETFAFYKSFTTSCGETIENKWIPSHATSEKAEHKSFKSILPTELFLLPPSVKPDFYALSCCMKPSVCLPASNALNPASNALNPTSMQDQLKYYKTNHGFSPEKFREYCMQFEDDAQLEKIHCYLQEKYDEMLANPINFQLQNTKEKVLEMFKIFSRSDRLVNIKRDIDSGYSKLKTDYLRFLEDEEKKGKKGSKWASKAVKRNALKIGTSIFGSL